MKRILKICNCVKDKAFNYLRHPIKNYVKNENKSCYRKEKICVVIEVSRSQTHLELLHVLKTLQQRKSRPHHDNLKKFKLKSRFVIV